MLSALEATVVGLEVTSLSVFSALCIKLNFQKFKGISFDGKPFPLPFQCLFESVKHSAKQH